MNTTHKLPCGCVAQRESENVERVIRQCRSCAAEFNERHEASAEERRVEREKLFVGMHS